jgi:hypothetical protein
MNFIDAVRELSEGRCNKIKRDDTILHIGLGGMLYIRDVPYLAHITSYLDDWELVDPVPQFEEVEVVRYLKESIDETYTFEQLGCPEDLTGYIKLTGTYRRKIKPKVKRREEINIEPIHRIFGDIPKYAKLYAEWEE